MNLREFRKCVEFNIEHGLRHAILGLGAPGLGKSQVIKQIGEKFGLKVIDLRLAQMSEVEIGGLIYPNEDRTKTRWLSPEILPDEERDGKSNILLLDEITSCSKRVQVAAYQLILDRRVGQYVLPKGTFVIALGNGEDDDGVYIKLAGPLADRFEIHRIEVDHRIWHEDFAIPYGIHPLVRNYLYFKPAALHSQQHDDEMIFATPRSWERVSEILKICDDVTDDVIANKIIGNVGSAEGHGFISFVNNRVEMFDADAFLGGSSEAPSDAMENSILVRALAERVSFVNNLRTAEELTGDELALLKRVIAAEFRLSSPEFTIVGLQAVKQLNPGLIKQVFREGDFPEAESFIEENKYMLGLE